MPILIAPASIWWTKHGFSPITPFWKILAGESPSVDISHMVGRLDCTCTSLQAAYKWQDIRKHWTLLKAADSHSGMYTATQLLSEHTFSALSSINCKGTLALIALKRMYIIRCAMECSSLVCKQIRFWSWSSCYWRAEMYNRWFHRAPLGSLPFVEEHAQRLLVSKEDWFASMMALRSDKNEILVSRCPDTPRSALPAPRLLTQVPTSPESGLHVSNDFCLSARAE